MRDYLSLVEHSLAPASNTVCTHVVDYPLGLHCTPPLSLRAGGLEDMDGSSPAVSAFHAAISDTAARAGASPEATERRAWRAVDALWTGGPAAFVLTLILLDVFFDSSDVADMLNETHHCVMWVGLYLRRHDDGVRFRLICLSLLLPWAAAIVLELPYVLYQLRCVGDACREDWPGWIVSLSHHVQLLGVKGAATTALAQLVCGFEQWCGTRPRSSDAASPELAPARGHPAIPFAAMLIDPILAVLSTVLSKRAFVGQEPSPSLGLVPGGVMLCVFFLWLSVPAASELSQRRLFCCMVVLPTLVALTAEQCFLALFLGRVSPACPGWMSALADQVTKVAAGCVGAWVVIMAERATS